MTTLQTPLTLATTATASATLVAGKHTPVDATSGAKTMTLPTPATVGARLRVEKVDTSANAVTISGTIRGSTGTITLTSQYETQELFAESLTSWRVASSHRTKAATDAAYGLPAQTGNAGKFLTTDGTAPSWGTPAGGGGAGLPATVVNRTTAYTAAAGDFVQADVTTAGFTVTLPTAPAVGALVAVKKVDATANTLTIAPSGGGTIDGDPTATTTTKMAGAIFEHVGTNVWRIVASMTTTGPAGPTGPSGSAATVAVGTTTTGAAGTSAAVTNSGTSSAATLNFTIPQGAAGATGQGVPTGGTTGQVLTKTSGTDFATAWQAPSGGGGSTATSTTAFGVGTGKLMRVPQFTMSLASAVLTGNELDAVPFLLNQSTSVTKLGCMVWTNGTAGSVIRLGIYGDAGGYPGTLLLDAGTINGATATTSTITTITLGTPLALSPGTYWAVLVGQGAPTTQPNVIWCSCLSSMISAASAPAGIGGYALSGVTGALPTTYTAGATLMKDAANNGGDRVPSIIVGA